MQKQSNKSKSVASPLLGEEENAKWLTVSFQPVSLFSLKRSDATSMAARTNLVPTPYAIKMALLKVLLEGEGHRHRLDFEEWIKQEFAWIRDLQIYVLPPEILTVNRNGYKLRYEDQIANKADKTLSTFAMQDGFVFREWIYAEGILQICCGKTSRFSELEMLFAQINYFGKRGCFFQYMPDASQITNEPLFGANYGTCFTVQLMDDLSSKTTFNKVNPYSKDKAQIDKDRSLQTGFLPLQLISTSARYDVYKRV